MLDFNTFRDYQSVFQFKLLEELVEAHPLALETPAPVICVGALADSSVNLLCRPWSNTEDYWALYWDMQQLVKERFDAEGISIPFPQRGVHLEKVNPDLETHKSASIIDTA